MAMSVFWCVMLFVSLLFSVLTKAAGLTAAMLDGAKAAVTLLVGLAGSLCLWSGLGKLLEGSGVSRRLQKLLAPILGKLFPTASKNPRAFAPLCANLCANLLGLGNAATPFGVAAVKELGQGQAATDEQCKLIVLNTASIQLLPTTVCAVRAACGAAAPFSILPAVWLTSALSVSVGLLCCRLFRRWL